MSGSEKFCIQCELKQILTFFLEIPLVMSLWGLLSVGKYLRVIRFVKQVSVSRLKLHVWSYKQKFLYCRSWGESDP